MQEVAPPFPCPFPGADDVAAFCFYIVFSVAVFQLPIRAVAAADDPRAADAAGAATANLATAIAFLKPISLCCLNAAVGMVNSTRPRIPHIRMLYGTLSRGCNRVASDSQSLNLQVFSGTA